MAGLQSPGIGSGLDISSIVSKLMAVEQRPLLQLDQKEVQVHAEISAYGSLKGALSGLQSSIGKLKEADTFEATTASSSDEWIFTVSADAEAVASAYDVAVNRLAQRHKLGSSEFAEGTNFGGGAGDELTLQANSESFTVDLSTAMTLQDIQAAINVSANDTGITAGIITGDSGKETLVLTAEDPGYDNRIQIAFGGAIDASTFNLATTNRDANGVLLASDTELDASLQVDGVTATRSSNTISDVVKGLTLSISDVGRAVATVSRDTSVATNAVTGFVTAYNGLRSELAGLSEGNLSGNRILLNVESQLRAVFNQPASDLGSFSYIQELGITSGEFGDLELDTDPLESALDTDVESLMVFFTDENSGFATRLDNVLNGFLQTGGMIDSMTDSANNRISDIERSRDVLERRLELTEKRLRSQFTALDGLVAQLSVTGDYLSQQLATLPSLFLNNNS